MTYNWQSDWPNFRYDLAEVQDDLLAFADKAGQVSGLLKALPDKAQTQTIVDVMISKTIGEAAARATSYTSKRRVLRDPALEHFDTSAKAP